MNPRFLAANYLDNFFVTYFERGFLLVTLVTILCIGRNNNFKIINRVTSLL